jgi:phage terminase large subunit
LKEKDIVYTYMRYTKPSLMHSVYLDFWDIFKKLNVPFMTDKGDYIINGNRLAFLGLKSQTAEEEDRIKGLNTNYLYFNEANELGLQEFMQLCARPRRENVNGINQLVFDFNPCDESSFLRGIVDNPAKNQAAMQFTWRDNRFITPERIEVLNQFRNQDEAYWKIYSEGMWATLQGIIYQFGLNWDIVNEFPDSFAQTGYGLDFGFNKPTCLTEMNVADKLPDNCPEQDKKKIHIYERALIYQTHLNDNELVRMMKEKIPYDLRHRIIWADSEDPSAIDTIKGAGFNIFAAQKPKDSVVDGIRAVKEYKIHHHIESVDTIKETRRYKWRLGKDGKPIDEPVKLDDHSKDPERYYIWNQLKHNKQVTEEEMSGAGVIGERESVKGW